MHWGAAERPAAVSHKPIMLKNINRLNNPAEAISSDRGEAAANKPPAISQLPRYMQNIATDGGIDIDDNGQVIGNQNLRDFFEFYLSLQGDYSLDEITQLLQLKAEKFDRTDGEISPQVMLLFSQYIGYKTALSELAEQSLSPLELLAEKRQLQHQFFDSQQVEQLFGDENSYMAYGIHRYQQQGLDPLYQQQLSDEAAANMGFHDQQANQRYYQQQQQLKALAKISQEDEEERYIAREALVGKAAAERLQQLDQQRQQWQQKVTDYELKMAELSSLSGLAEQDVAEQQQRYIEQHFSRTEQKRLTANSAL
ncbi:Lipase chaperone [Sinobacterium norvegicum]|uniref:Lipase chaperone n=1 Tax=Sinobacterium norvegicum TaxID=1641715 RepID=A0ABM9AF20_9GAMM|nr:lipase secretion chaperone [Sinobacterium norvegicum]CAH0991782.1 Lipase chaperone [Sinobacterium norvegicum]